MKYWLIKSEPDSFSIDDLAKAKLHTTMWDGVRNFQARNFMRDEMAKGDLAFFYHSSCDVPGIAGIVKVVREAYPDPTAFDKEDHHYDADSDPDKPRWMAINVKLERKFDRIVTLDELRRHADNKLKDLRLLRRGNRLSITPVAKTDWQFILSLQDSK
jgi:predicted RNA-binding protein with PUA-like domain